MISPDFADYVLHGIFRIHNSAGFSTCASLPSRYHLPVSSSLSSWWEKGGQEELATAASDDLVSLIHVVGYPEHFFDVNKKLAKVNAILLSLCKAQIVDWNIVSRVLKILGPWTESCHLEALLPFLEFVLKDLPNDKAAGGRNLEDILRLLTLIRPQIFSSTVIERLHTGHDFFVREFPSLSASDVITSRLLLVIPTLARTNLMALCSLCYDSLAPRLYLYPLPERHSQLAGTIEVSRAVQRLNMYHKDFLTSYAAYFQRMVESMNLRVTHGATLWMLSYMNFPAHELFESARTVLDVPGRQWSDVHFVYPYIRLNWAFLAQGIEPPHSTMATMWEKLAAIMELGDSVPVDDNMPNLLVRMLEQLLIYAPPSLQVPQFMMKLLSQQFGFRLASYVCSHIPSLGMFFLSPAGVIWICGIFDIDTGFIVPWPADIRPEVVTADTPLPGVPVALLFSDTYTMLYGSSKRNGVVEWKHSKLCELGWHVAYVRIGIHSISVPIENFPAFCLDTMQKVAMCSVSSASDSAPV